MKVKKSILCIITLLTILLLATDPLLATPDVVAQLRLYEGFKVDKPTPAEVVTSYFLKPLTGEDVFADVDIAKEKTSLKRVFSLKDINLITRAGIILKKSDVKAAGHVIILNGRELLLQLSVVKGQKNRFKVEVLEKKKTTRSLLETRIVLPEKKTTVLGFEDSGGKIYFLSFHRGLDTKSGVKAVNIKDIKRPKLIKSPQPKYPKEALKAGVSGTVTIEATTDVYGRVVKAVIQDGHPKLRLAALQAVKQWVYEPYLLDGKPTPVCFTVYIKFNLAKKKEEKPVALSAIEKPKLLKNPRPEYPKEALKAGIDGNVIIEAVTDVKGRVKSAKVIDGPPELRFAALDALKRWVYEPYMVDGVAKPVMFTVVIKFRLDKDKKAGKPGKAPVVLSTDQKPKIVKKVDPKYPKDALKQGVKGNVVVELTVDTAGRVKSAKIIDGDPLLRPAALNAVKQWRYEVYYLDGEPVPVKFTVVIKFHLN